MNAGISLRVTSSKHKILTRYRFAKMEQNEGAAPSAGELQEDPDDLWQPSLVQYLVDAGREHDEDVRANEMMDFKGAEVARDPSTTCMGVYE